MVEANGPTVNTETVQVPTLLPVARQQAMVLFQAMQSEINDTDIEISSYDETNLVEYSTQNHSKVKFLSATNDTTANTVWPHT
jgi:hypothetical protein